MSQKLPTIAELEKILSDNSYDCIETLPNGEIRAYRSTEQGDQVDAMVSGLLPTIDEAGVIAVSMSEHLTAQEQSFFIAGFQECIKYLTQGSWPCKETSGVKVFKKSL